MSRALVVLLVLGSGCASPAPRRPAPPRVAPEPAPEIPMDPALGLRVSLPGASVQLLKQWRLRPDQSYAWEAPTEPGQPGDGATMNAIIGDPRPATVPWAQHWRQLSQEYKLRAAAVQEVLEEGQLQVPGAESAWYFVIQRTEQGQRFVLFQALVGTGAHIYYLTYGVRDEAFEGHRELFLRSARSLRPEP